MCYSYFQRWPQWTTCPHIHTLIETLPHWIILALWPTLTNGMWQKWDMALAVSTFALVGALSCHLRCLATLLENPSGDSEALSLHGKKKEAPFSEHPSWISIPAACPKFQTCDCSHLGCSIWLQTHEAAQARPIEEPSSWAPSTESWEITKHLSV